MNKKQAKKIVNQAIQQQKQLTTYKPKDVILMVEAIKQEDFDFTTVDIKEKNIQNNLKHYSEMLSEESYLTEEQKKAYHWAMDKYKTNVALGIIYLVEKLKKIQRQNKDKDLVLISLVRAGLPLGTSLLMEYNKQEKQANLERGKELRLAHHYGVSIIRDKGLDKTAMNAIIALHPEAKFVFIDGWIGKGAITKELTTSFKRDFGLNSLDYELIVLCDPTNYKTAISNIKHVEYQENKHILRKLQFSDYAYSSQDWLIPFSIIGSPISGLMSRTIYQDNGLHKAVFYQDEQFLKDNLTYKYLTEIAKEIELIKTIVKKVNQREVMTDKETKCYNYIKNELTTLFEFEIEEISKPTEKKQNKFIKGVQTIVKQVKKDFNVIKTNNIKPGIAEATRAVLRRLPEKVLVSDLQSEDLTYLLEMCKQHNVNIEVYEKMKPFYKAITIIKAK